MSKELEKNYNPSEIEDRLYQKWLDKKYFHAEVDRSKKPFTIVSVIRQIPLSASPPYIPVVTLTMNRTAWRLWEIRR